MISAPAVFLSWNAEHRVMERTLTIAVSRGEKERDVARRRRHGFGCLAQRKVHSRGMRLLHLQLQIPKLQHPRPPLQRQLYLLHSQAQVYQQLEQMQVV